MIRIDAPHRSEVSHLQQLASVHRGTSVLKLWFSDTSTARRFAAEQGGQAVRVGVQAVVLPAARSDDADVIIMLRLQNERMSGALLPSASEYFSRYGLTPQKLALAKPDAIVLHPGPMNRGVEIDSAVADGTQSVILPQVTFGIAVRMAVMAILAGATR